LYKLNVAQNTFVNKPHSRSTWAHFHENIQFNSSPDPWKINRAAANLPKVVFTHEVWFMRNLKCTAENSLRVWSHLSLKKRKDQTHWNMPVFHCCCIYVHFRLMNTYTVQLTQYFHLGLLECNLPSIFFKRGSCAYSSEGSWIATIMRII